MTEYAERGKSCRRKVPLSTKLATYMKRNWMLYVMMLPGLAVLLLFKYVPMYGVLMAFEKNYTPVKGVLGTGWVGLKHFTKFVRSPFFKRLMGNTLALGISKLVFYFPAPIILALLLNSLRSERFKRVIQTVSYVPHFVSTVIVIGILRDMCSPSEGFFNDIITAFGGKAINFFAEPGWFRPLYIFSDLWQGIGYSSIVYLAAISGINPELYESAVLDGANKFQQAVHITVPCISSTIITLLIFAVGGILGNDSQKILLMYNPLTYKTADVIGTYVYREGLLGGSYSYTSAIGLFNSVISVFFLVITNYAARKFSETSLF